MKRDHFTRLINLQNGSSNPEKKKKFFFLNFFFFTCTRSWAFQLAPRQISPEVSLVWLSKGSYTKEEGMQLNGNHVDGEILSVTKNKYAFTEVS